jgi:putative PIN family toxin of toxin-antitoxin system
MRVVLDNNVVISGFLWPGVCTRLFDFAIDGHISLFTSKELIDELGEVIHREKHASSVARTRRSAKELVKQYQRLAEMVSAKKFTQQICRDADDDAVLACALAAKADIIISGDKDLLALHPFRNIPILSPANAVRLLQRDTE